MKILLCKKCGKKLKGQQLSYCSPRCSKNHLKSLYKKRNKNKVNTYNREWRKRKRDDNKVVYKSKVVNLLSGSYKSKCYFCESRENLVKHHIKYKPELIVRLCDTCHKKYHKIEIYKNKRVGECG